MNPKSYSLVAIDISKDSLQVLSTHSSFALSNDRSGFQKLAKALDKLDSPFVVFEATGGYERGLREFLHQAAIPLSLLNPARVRFFAASEGIKAKTDPIDAQVILRFAQEKSLKPTPAPTAAQADLAALMDRRSHLTEQLTREKTRLQKCPQLIAEFIRSMIHSVEAQIQKVETQIRSLIHKNKTMDRQDKILQSVQGVGEVTSWTLLAYFQEISHLKRNEIVALAGIAPFNKDSGKARKKRSIQGGRAKVRGCLYMAAQTAARVNPVIKPYVQGLQERGKPYKCAIVAAMRKLLLHLRSLLINEEKSLA